MRRTFGPVFHGGMRDALSQWAVQLYERLCRNLLSIVYTKLVKLYCETSSFNISLNSTLIGIEISFLMDYMTLRESEEAMWI